jgi:hypothetical protein
MANSILDDLIDRLEVRQMESAEYAARWCPCCLRTELRNPFVMLHAGGDGSCKQQIQTGTIRECLESLKGLRREIEAAPSD